jgi:NAD(P)-dependent dehydrogenase (short-subunit alcohol dehydrogenase family)
MGREQHIVLISVSSDIGTAIAWRFLSRGWAVSGTYRTKSDNVSRLDAAGAGLHLCDLTDTASILNASTAIARSRQWDVLVLCPGTLKPISPFASCNFTEWENSLHTNFTRQLAFVHHLLPCRNLSGGTPPTVLFFAGGGTNNATVNYSAYTISKIALIKMCELLDAEILDTKFTIIGPGWVNTKIHKETLAAGTCGAGGNYANTLKKLERQDCTIIEQVVDNCDWVVNAPKEVVGGRNFSTVFDRWGSAELETALRNDHDMYKLRRHGNDIAKRG